MSAIRFLEMTLVVRDQEEFFFNLTGLAGADVQFQFFGFRDGEPAQNQRMNPRS
jgi:hypothetical protein